MGTVTWIVSTYLKACLFWSGFKSFFSLYSPSWTLKARQLLSAVLIINGLKNNRNKWCEETLLVLGETAYLTHWSTRARDRCFSIPTTSECKIFQTNLITASRVQVFPPLKLHSQNDNVPFVGSCHLLKI